MPAKEACYKESGVEDVDILVHVDERDLSTYREVHFRAEYRFARLEGLNNRQLSGLKKSGHCFIKQELADHWETECDRTQLFRAHS